MTVKAAVCWEAVTDNSVPGVKHREDVEKLNMDRSSNLGLHSDFEETAGVPLALLHSPVQFELCVIKNSLLKLQMKLRGGRLQFHLRITAVRTEATLCMSALLLLSSTMKKEAMTDRATDNER